MEPRKKQHGFNSRRCWDYRSSSGFNIGSTSISTSTLGLLLQRFLVNSEFLNDLATYSLIFTPHLGVIFKNEVTFECVHIMFDSRLEDFDSHKYLKSFSAVLFLNPAKHHKEFF